MTNTRVIDRAGGDFGSSICDFYFWGRRAHQLLEVPGTARAAAAAAAAAEE